MFRSAFGHRQAFSTSGGTSVPITAFEGIFVNYASTANIADLTACSTTMDGATLTEGKTVWLKDQSVAAQNGGYYVDSVSGTDCVLVRIPGLAAGDRLSPGFAVYVGAGSVNAGLHFRVTGTASLILGTNSITVASDSTDLSATISADDSLVSRYSVADSSIVARFSAADSSIVTRFSTAVSSLAAA